MKKTVKIFFVFLSAILALFCAELISRRFFSDSQVVRVVFKGDEVAPRASFKLSDDPVLLYEWRQPPQEAPKKQRGVYRILVLGDSVVFRKDRDIKDYFPARL